MRLSLAFGAALIGAFLTVGPVSTPASAAPITAAFSQDLLLSQFGNNELAIQVRDRRHIRWRYYRRGRDGSAAGAAAAGAAFGLFLGAIIASEAQRQQAVDYCMRRFRSYDPQSMTYLGYDGRRHPCP